MGTRIVRHGDADAFLRSARSWLLQTEAENTLVLGIAAQHAHDPAPNYFATIEQDGAVVGCAVRTPPRQVVLTRMPPAAVDPLVFDLSVCYAQLPGVVGPPAAATSFAATWAGRHGLRHHVAMEQRLYRLTRVIPPAIPAPGEMRIAGERDAALVISWVDCFARESGVTVNAAAHVRARIAAGEMALWHHDAPRAMAGYSGRSPHGVRIGYVYTPPEFRGRGYASACVAALSQHALVNGAHFCCLYTDLANPTSNSIYRKIGYEPLCDSVEIVFRAS